MMGEWTEGEWRFNKKTACVETEARILAHVKTPFYVEEGEANGQLMATAKSLYEALEALLPFYEDFVSDCGHDPAVGIDCSADYDRIEAAQKALAKARGEQS